MHVGLLTGGDDKSYAVGLTMALVAENVAVDFIGSDAVDSPELHRTEFVNFLNLRGDQREDVSLQEKVRRIVKYYWRLLKYGALGQPLIFHILWNNKFELLDRIGLMLHYRLMGRKVVLTAHNVNAAKRDSRDSCLNRISLRIQYALARHIFVHTDRMKSELMTDFGVSPRKVTVIPFGINNAFPSSGMTSSEAKERLGLSGEKTVLFFGQIAPYKGLEYLVGAMAELATGGAACHLMIAGKVKRGCTQYWDAIQAEIIRTGLKPRVSKSIHFIRDEDVELYFKAADVLIIPYVHIFQSGVPFLGYSFGLPVIAADVGSLKDDIVEGQTGFICRARDSADLAATIRRYFDSELYRDLARQRSAIREYANDRYSWSKVATMTTAVYSKLLQS